MDIDDLKLVLANIDEILNNDDLKIIMDGVDIDENAEFESKFILINITLKFCRTLFLH